MYICITYHDILFLTNLVPVYSKFCKKNIDSMTKILFRIGNYIQPEFCLTKTNLKLIYIKRTLTFIQCWFLIKMIEMQKLPIRGLGLCVIEGNFNVSKPLTIFFISYFMLCYFLSPQYSYCELKCE